MSLTPSPPSRRGLTVLLILALVLAFLTPPAAAADTLTALPAVLPAFDLQDIVRDRSRLIQFSVVAVGIGIALLWWGQKT